MIENELEFIKKSSQKILHDRSVTVGAKALFFYILNIENTEYPDRNKIAFYLNISNSTLLSWSIFWDDFLINSNSFSIIINHTPNKFILYRGILNQPNILKYQVFQLWFWNVY